jgi:hypothetical protein
MVSKKSKVILALIFLGAAFYTNYNLPVIQQIFSYYFYESVEAQKVKGGFGCISVNIARVDTIFDRNQFILRGGTIAPSKYEFFIDGNRYELSKRSYIGEPFSCSEIITQVYYYPNYPQWSVADNRFPETAYWRNFLITSFVFLGFIVLCLFLLKGYNFSYKLTTK